METNGKYNMLEYRLRDVLEMKYTSGLKALQTVIRKLLSRPIKDHNLHPFFAFALEDTLIVIQDGNLKRLRRLYLLNARHESISTFDMKQGDRGKSNDNGGQI